MPHFSFSFFQKKPESAPLLLEISYHAPEEHFVPDHLSNRPALDLLALPSDVIALMMRCLNKADFVRFARVCKRLHGIAFHHENNLFWNVLQQDFTRLVNNSKFLHRIKKDDEIGIVVTKEIFLKKPEAFQNLLKTTQDAVTAEQQKIAYRNRQNNIERVFCVPNEHGINFAIVFLLIAVLAFSLSMYLLAHKESFKTVFTLLVLALILESVSASCLFPKLLSERYEKRQSDWHNKLYDDAKKVVSAFTFLKKSLSEKDIESGTSNEETPLVPHEMKTLNING